jgi:hypothetical protein
MRFIAFQLALLGTYVTFYLGHQTLSECLSNHNENGVELLSK